MQLDSFNNLLNNIKENSVVQNFINELSNYLESINDKLSNQQNNINSLKQEDWLYQVVDMGTDEKYTIKVPNELIPFWAKSGEKLYYANGDFNRVL